MGTVSATDKGFIDWLAQQPKSVSKNGTNYCMNLYVQNLNFEDKIIYDRQLKEYNDKLLAMEGSEPTPSAEHIEVITAEINEDHNMNIPNSLNISSPSAQNTPQPQSQEQLSTPIPRTSFPQQSELTPSILSAPKYPGN